MLKDKILLVIISSIMIIGTKNERKGTFKWDYWRKIKHTFSSINNATHIGFFNPIHSTRNALPLLSQIPITWQTVQRHTFLRRKFQHKWS